MNVTTAKTKKNRNSCKEHFTHARSSRQDADDSAQRDYDLPILSQKEITDNYERDDNDDNEKGNRVAQRKLCKGHSTHTHSSSREIYDSAQRDYDLTIHCWNAITDDYERDNNDDE